MSKPFFKTAGFTLLELLITLSIFIVMTTLLLANQHKLSNSLDLTNLAYDISLTIRQAQTYGFSVKGQQQSGNLSDFQNYYGIHIAPYGTNGLTSFIIFADAPTSINNGQATAPNFKYDNSDPIVTTYNLKPNYTITQVCDYTINTNGSCNSTYSTDIIFKRPNPEATIRFYDSNNIQQGGPTSHVRIKLKSPDGRLIGVDVYSSGQIAVVDTN